MSLRAFDAPPPGQTVVILITGMIGCLTIEGGLWLYLREVARRIDDESTEVRRAQGRLDEVLRRCPCLTPVSTVDHDPR